MKISDIRKDVKAGLGVDSRHFLENFDSGLDFPSVLKLRKLWSLNGAAKLPCMPNHSYKVAITGSGTLDYLLDCLNDRLVYSEKSTSLFVSQYNNYVQDLLDPSSDLNRFEPDCIVFVVDSTIVWDMDLSNIDSDESSVLSYVNRKVEFIADLLKPFADRGCDVLITNAIPEPVDSPSSLRRRYQKSSWNVVQKWNAMLDALNSDGIRVVDVSFLAIRRGIDNSYSFKQWFESKLPYALDFHAAVASLISNEITRKTAADNKVLVLDCDNTIWGGVVGDDGLGGIEIGTISARAQAFQGLQRHIKRLKNLGFLLAVSSKNEESSVMRVFREHPDMILRESDIVAFKVNWRSKADNIAEIALELNLGLDSFVFLDDNPAEISIVNQFLPEVSTILASKDPVETLQKLHDSPLLYRTSVSADDSAKTEQYITEKKRKELSESVTNYDEYLLSLEMCAEIELITSATSARASQLINKSNQFNLTTIRRSEAEILSLMNDDEWNCYTVRLSDKFGDHGIVSVLLTKASDIGLIIETFVMSCRVLKRGLEGLIINHLASVAKLKGLDALIGLYTATEKNIIVADLYVELGFEVVSDSSGEKKYSRDLKSYDNIDCHIAVDSN